MIGGFEPSLEFLNQSVPLWFALLMAFTSPYLWSSYVKKFMSDQYTARFGDNKE